MIKEFNVYTIAFKTGSRVSWSAILEAKTDDGRSKEKVIAQPLPSLTKNQADILSLAKALQCIKPEFRSQVPVTIYGPPGYAMAMVEKNRDGLWKTEPKANLEEIGDARSMINKYVKIEVKRIDQHSQQYRRCIDIARRVLPPEEEKPAQESIPDDDLMAQIAEADKKPEPTKQEGPDGVE